MVCEYCQKPTDKLTPVRERRAYGIVVKYGCPQCTP